MKFSGLVLGVLCRRNDTGPVLTGHDERRQTEREAAAPEDDARVDDGADDGTHWLRLDVDGRAWHHHRAHLQQQRQQRRWQSVTSATVTAAMAS